MFTGEPMFDLVIGALFSALIGSLIGGTKGRSGAGAVLGLLIGPIGWLLVAVGKDRRPKCPECGGVIVPGARRCKNCGASLVAEPTARRAQPHITFRKKSASAETVACPHCVQPILKSSLVVGHNTCPSCAQVFDVEQA